jgi:BirA family biotin operon repressor/biotin-[acetyl-CoA-carboxylase] ligase
MSSLDVGKIRQALSAKTTDRLDELEVFGSIASTNTYLIAQAPPAAERLRVAIADHQTSGRGRHYRRWISPPGAGLYMSIAYSFEEQPDQLPSLTLATGVGVIDALAALGIDGVTLKWPNDVVALDGKLGGILTEIQSRPTDGVTVVTGIGINLAFPEDAEASIESDWAARTVDLSKICDPVPDRSEIAAVLLDHVHDVMRKFAAFGFATFAQHWARYDWLHKREVIVDQSDKQILGVAAGVDQDGALLVDTDDGRTRIVSGSVMVAGLAA